MNPEQINSEAEKQKHPICIVTPLSKYLAMAIFIAMPFVGGYIGYLNGKNATQGSVDYSYQPNNTDNQSPTINAVTEEKISTSSEKINFGCEEMQGGKLCLIPLTPPLAISGTVEGENEMIGGLTIRVDEASQNVLTSLIGAVEEWRPGYINLPVDRAMYDVTSGDAVSFVISEYVLDTRRIDTTNSGTLVSIQKN